MATYWTCSRQVGGWASIPADHRLAGAALDLPQQSLGAADVDEPDMPGVYGHLPPAGIRVLLPPPLASANLVQTQHPHRRQRGRQHPLGVRSSRGHHRRPRQPQIPPGLLHRDTPVTNSPPGQQPAAGS
jgi:hypothetical protein